MVDPKSYELAEAFLDDFYPVTEKLTMELAQVIQEAIEDWLNAAEREGRIGEKDDITNLRSAPARGATD